MTKTIIGMLAVVLISAVSANAAVVTLQAVADANSIDSGWTVLSGGGADGIRDAIEDNGTNTGAYANYTVTFPVAGTYSLYMLAKTSDTDGDTLTTTNDRLRLSRANATGVWSGTYAAQVIRDLDYTWYNISAAVGANLTYVVDAPGEIGVPLTFQVRTDSEPGQVIDTMVFSTDGAMSDAALNALIPEPATMSLLAIGGLVAMRRRRR